MNISIDENNTKLLPKSSQITFHQETRNCCPGVVQLSTDKDEEVWFLGTGETGSQEWSKDMKKGRNEKKQHLHYGLRTSKSFT